MTRNRRGEQVSVPIRAADEERRPGQRSGQRLVEQDEKHDGERNCRQQRDDGSYAPTE